MRITESKLRSIIRNIITEMSSNIEEEEELEINELDKYYRDKKDSITEPVGRVSNFTKELYGPVTFRSDV